ncbi:MAG: Gfo/Idh/MocA family oxidoreductase [Planctomycetota bacterium]
MVRVGIVGLGFMGKMHFRCYKARKDSQIAAVFDLDTKKLTDTSGTAGNIKGAEEQLDFSGIELYSDFDRMLAEAKLDAVSIALPTYMHKAYTIKALSAGLHVLCEKPMALNVSDCDEMIEAAKKTGRVLMIGHCIRFWPEYAKAKELIESSCYGKVLAAHFQRLASTPIWSWDNWLLDGSRSGGAALDLHIHDSDYVQYLFGMPGSVCSRGWIGKSGDYDYIVTSYIYEKEKVATAQGGWIMAPGFGFRMSFDIMLEKATISYDCTRDPAFKVYLAQGRVETPQVPAGDGYSQEIDYFVKVIQGKNVPKVLTPQQARDAVRLVTAEKESADCGKEVAL